MLEKYKSLSDAKGSFDKVSTKYGKILVDGTTGKLVEKDGERRWVAQNLMYMY